MVNELPWIADGVKEREEYAVDALREISTFRQETAAELLSFPWIEDSELADHELDAISIIAQIMFEAPQLIGDVLDFSWVADGITPSEGRGLGMYLGVLRRDKALARPVLQSPFMDAPFLARDAYALGALLVLRGYGDEPDSPLLTQIINQSWYADGLDDGEAALLHAIRYVEHDLPLAEALIESHYLASESFVFPLTGDMGVGVVSTTPIPPEDDTLEVMKAAFRALQGFIVTPLPANDVVVLLVDPERWEYHEAVERRGTCSGDGHVNPCVITYIILALNDGSGPAKEALQIALAQSYMEFNAGWLGNGIERFLAAYISSETGGEGVEERLARLESSGRCNGQVWQYVSEFADRVCRREVGERFLLRMYDSVGPEIVAGALEVLSARGRVFEEADDESIYEAFLSSVPEGEEEAFKEAYRLHHGGPVVDRVQADSIDLPVLMAIFDATGGEGWRNNYKWGSDALPGAWHRVETDFAGRVTGLQLRDNGLVGQLSAELGQLDSLKILDLWSNELVGEIPSGLGGLMELEQLTLSSNRLTGAIPRELGNLANLQRLDLRRNDLSGEIPRELGNLTNLRELELDQNELIGGIPPELGNLAGLLSLSLRRNNLTGELPPELGNLVNLRRLNLEDNGLNGEIPIELANMVSLERLWLGGNSFTGCIAEELPEIWVEETGLERCEG